MASVITPTRTPLPESGDSPVWIVQWANMGNGDTGAPIGDNDSMTIYGHRSVQVEGTFGSNGSVSLEGNNDGTNNETLKDIQGVAMTFTAKGIKESSMVTRNFRPNVTAGDGTTSLTVTVLLRRSAPHL